MAKKHEPSASAPHRDRLLRLREVAQIAGLSRTAVYRAEADGRFPKRRRIGLRAVAWSEAEVLAWIASREQVQP